MTISHKTLSAIPLLGIFALLDTQEPYKNLRILLHIIIALSLFLPNPLNGIVFVLLNAGNIYLTFETQQPTEDYNSNSIPQSCIDVFAQYPCVLHRDEIIETLSSYVDITITPIADAIGVEYKNQLFCIIGQNETHFIFAAPKSIFPVQGIQEFDQWQIHEYALSKPKGYEILLQNIIKKLQNDRE